MICYYITIDKSLCWEGEGVPSRGPKNTFSYFAISDPGHSYHTDPTETFQRRRSSCACPALPTLVIRTPPVHAATTVTSGMASAVNASVAEVRRAVKSRSSNKEFQCDGDSIEGRHPASYQREKPHLNKEGYMQNGITLLWPNPSSIQNPVYIIKKDEID